MSQMTNIYLSMHLLFSLSFLFLWILKRYLNFNFSSLLRLNYFSLSLAFVLPFLMQARSDENPFGPVVKVWSEPLQSAVHSVSIKTMGIRLEATPLSPSFAWTSGDFIYTLILLLITGFLFWRSCQFIHGVWLLTQRTRNSFPFKRIGRVRIWLNEETSAPFSFYNGFAHIVLPMNSVESPENFKISILHEIQHHRQKDTLWVYTFEVIKALFGMNPIVKKLISQIEEFQELACDEVLVGHKKISPHAYGKCLLGFAEQQLSQPQSLIGAVGIVEKTSTIKRRIDSMFQHKSPLSKRAFISAVATVVSVMAGTAWAVQGVVGTRSLTLKQAQSLALNISKGQEIPIVVDSNVLHWLNKALETEQSRQYMRESLRRMKSYQKMITRKLEKSSLPLELLAVPLVESGFKNDLHSSANGRGIWQFIPETARYCGLEVDDQVDERLNPSLLTDAAVCYYRKLHAVFQNWHVALAAYNIGEQAMTRAISKAGHNDVFKLSREGKLGVEGSNYLPKLIAGMIIMKNPELVE